MKTMSTTIDNLNSLIRFGRVDIQRVTEPTHGAPGLLVTVHPYDNRMPSFSAMRFWMRQEEDLYGGGNLQTAMLIYLLSELATPHEQEGARRG